MTDTYIVTVDVPGRGAVCYARCLAAQLAATVAVAAAALLAESDWIAQYHSGFTFTVAPG